MMYPSRRLIMLNQHGPPFRCGISTGMISSAKSPLSIAVTALLWLRNAHSSCLSRLMPISFSRLIAICAHMDAGKLQVNPS